ncbi:MAG TPA: hypothetical protein PK417_04675 [Hyphomonas sp.]|nr:hypothetical protein [Hyphomonas sp.]HRX73932.1 hypothetical protein [Hyphomonas sp.]
MSDEAAPNQPRFSTDDLERVDLNTFLDGIDVIDVERLGDSLVRKSKEIEDAALKAPMEFLAAVLQISFNPEDAAQPFHPRFQMDGRRSPIPSDFQGALAQGLAKIAPRTMHAGCRARFADIAWLNNRGRPDLAELALNSYCECAELVLDGKFRHEFSEKTGPDYRTIDFVRRAFQIAKAIKGKKDFPDRLLELLCRLIHTAEEGAETQTFRRAHELAMDFGVLDSEEIPVQLEKAADWDGIDLHSRKSLLELAVRGYRRIRSEEDENRCQMAVAETTVLIADAGDSSAMFVSHWLMQAISEMRLARGDQARNRCEELRKRLRAVQEDTHFEMGRIEHKIDLTDLANDTLARVKGLTWGAVLFEVARLSLPVDPSALRASAEKNLSEHPLSAMFGGSRIDGEGKVVGRKASYSEGSDGEAILDQIADEMSHRRQIMVSGMFRPVQFSILQDMTVCERDFRILCGNSPFVPPGYEEVFALGFARLFQGDMVSAANILLPTLEPSLRYVLKTTGQDSSKIEGDMTQEDRSLSSLLEYEEQALTRIFGEAILFQIDMLFNSRKGPALRHEHAHGKLTAAACYHPDVIFACWFIFQLTALPFFGDWSAIAADADRTAGDRSALPVEESGGGE